MMIMPVLNSDGFTLSELWFEKKKGRYIYSVYWMSAMTHQEDNKIAGAFIVKKLLEILCLIAN